MIATAVFLTLKLASVTTLLLLLTGVPLAWWLANRRGRLKVFVEAIIGLPLVLPPTVLGFYLLLAFSPESAFGRWWLALSDSTLAFSFAGLVVASVFYSLPFVVQPLQRAFEQLDGELLEAATMLGSGTFDRLFAVVLPNTHRALLLAACMGFAHTVGEFGVVLMIGGNIPGETQVLSIALFDAVESQRFADAHRLAGGLVVFSLVLLMLLYSIDLRRTDMAACRHG